MHIFYTNNEVSGHNEAMLKQLEGEMVTLQAKKDGPKGYTAPINTDGRIGSTQFFDKLNIKIGARIALTFNVNTIDGLVNGACGTIIGIESTTKLAKEKRVHAVIVRFDDENCGREQRQKHQRFSRKYEKENGTPIFRTDLEYNIPSKKGFAGSAVAKVEQFPLRINYASTAHRMQGQTVKAGSKVILHWHKRMKHEHGMAYVMLGRTEKLEDIYISGEIDFNGISCYHVALKESNRLLAKFKESESKKMAENNDSLTLSYLNIRSLRNKINTITKAPILMQSDVLSFGETWLKSNEIVELDGFESFFASYGKGKGVAVYSKSHPICEPQTLSNEKLSLIVMRLDQLTAVFVYRSQDCEESYLCSTLEQIMKQDLPMVIMGDMNIDIEKNSVLKSYLTEKNFAQLIKKPTFDNGSTLDHLYVTEQLKNAKIEQTSVYFSDHDVITLKIKMS